MQKKKRFNLTFRQRQQIGGFLFTAPFLVGFVFFFVYPMIQAVAMSLSEMILTPDTFELEFLGLENFRYALTVHPDFSRVFTEVLVELVMMVPLVIGFSFFAAILINQDFKGRAIVRALFFLPVIMGAGVIMKLELEDYSLIMLEHAGESARFGGAALRYVLENSFIPGGFIDYVVDAAAALPAVIRASGVQILIFLAGLQSVPHSIYEAAAVEGATPWERFWLITFPVLSPLILTNTVYTVIDFFVRMDNELVLLIRDTMLKGAGYGASMAMAMIYFSVIAVVLVVVYAILSKRVFYQV